MGRTGKVEFVDEAPPLHTTRFIVRGYQDTDDGIPVDPQARDLDAIWEWMDANPSEEEFPPDDGNLQGLIADDEHGHTVFALNAENLTSLVTTLGELDLKVGMAEANRAQQAAKVWRFAVKAANDAADLLNLDASSRQHRVDMAKRSVIEEIAAMLRIPAVTAEAMVRTAITLEDRLPATLQAVADGLASFGHAQILADQSYSLDDAQLAELEATTLPKARMQTRARFSTTVRKARERLAPEAAVERQVRAVEKRSVQLIPQKDGMADLVAHLPAVQAVAIYNRAVTIARGLKAKKNETRTLTQLTADVLSDILLDADSVDDDGNPITTAGQGDGPVARYRSIKPTVLVTIPASTVTRDGNEPGVLEGYGPIDPQTSREIAANGNRWRRLLTDPITGAVLAIGTKRYRPTKDQKAWLRVRDGTCRWIGCNRAAVFCDIDHTLAWEHGGHTDCDNLAHLCKKHHIEKHNTDWELSQDEVGTMTSVSPAGFTYITEPDVKVAPIQPARPNLIEETPPF